MTRYDFTSPRLFCDVDLTAGTSMPLDRAQANYMLNVLRLETGGEVLLFNGRDGEWLAHVQAEGRKKAHLIVDRQIREQPQPNDLHYLFAPLKQARLEYMVQKAVEMGVGRLQPVLTQFTQMRKFNLDKARTYVTEAAEQCGVLALPSVQEPQPLKQCIEAADLDRQIIFCDEGDGNQNPLPILQSINTGKLAVLIGPEGGFSEDERAFLRARENVTAIPLGPRVLRADTAAVAALSLVQCVLGDWKDG